MIPLYRPVQPELSSRDKGVFYKEIPPSRGLSEFIYCYWTLHAPMFNPNFMFHAVPDVCIDIFFNFSKFSHSKLIGCASQSRTAPVEANSDYFGIRFLPGQVNRFFLLPVKEIHDKSIDFRELAGKKFFEIEEKMINAGSLRERIFIIESFLINRLCKGLYSSDKRFDMSLANIYLNSGMKSVKQLSEDANVSPRHLCRLFDLNLGLSPKFFSRVIRFQKILHHFVSGTYSCQLDMALDHGFFDQSHFIKDFQLIYGKKPIFFKS